MFHKILLVAVHRHAVYDSPLTRAETGSLVTNTAAAPEARQRNHVLVVDDNVEARLALSTLLRIAGYVVYEAADADQALVLLGSSLPVDGVVSDVQMPGSKNGLELAEHLRQTLPGLHVVLVSALDVRDQVAALGLRFFRKPYEPDALISHLTHLLQDAAP